MKPLEQEIKELKDRVCSLETNIDLLAKKVKKPKFKSGDIVYVNTYDTVSGVKTIKGFVVSVVKYSSSYDGWIYSVCLEGSEIASKHSEANMVRSWIVKLFMIFI